MVSLLLVSISFVSLNRMVTFSQLSLSASEVAGSWQLARTMCHAVSTGSARGIAGDTDMLASTHLIRRNPSTDPKITDSSSPVKNGRLINSNIYVYKT